MDMGTTTSATATAVSTAMNMAASTASAAAAAATTTAATMSMSSGSSCQISMLWNWYTIDSCFIARSWHVRSRGGFAGTCIGIVFLGMAVELVRRLQREYDRFIYAQHLKKLESGAGPEMNAMSPEGTINKGNNIISQNFISKMFAQNSIIPASFSPSIWQQAIRAWFYVLQYAGAYFIMLLAMYYNGYVIICIFIGGYLGNFFFSADSFQDGGAVKTQKTCCC